MSPHDLGLELKAKYNILLFLTFFEGNGEESGKQVATLQTHKNQRKGGTVLQDMCLTLAFRATLKKDSLCHTFCVEGQANNNMSVTITRIMQLSATTLFCRG